MVRVAVEDEVVFPIENQIVPLEDQEHLVECCKNINDNEIFLSIYSTQQFNQNLY